MLSKLEVKFLKNLKLKSGISAFKLFFFFRHLIGKSRCENTHLCSSLQNTNPTSKNFCAAGSSERQVHKEKKKEHNNNFVGRTPKEKGERVTLCR